MKAYTDLDQSRKLTEFLPSESANMHYMHTHIDIIRLGKPYKETDVPAWSLVALLDILPYPHLEQNYKDKWYCRTEYADTTYLWEADNPVDACVEMILRLHEQKLL